MRAEVALNEKTIHLPEGIGIPTLSPPPEKTEGAAPFQVLVVRSPVQWLLSLYLLSKTYQEFRGWYKNNPPSPQSIICPSPDHVVRAEYFQKDMAEIGVKGTISLYLVPRLVSGLCVATRADIRRRYAKDYELGEYD